MAEPKRDPNIVFLGQMFAATALWASTFVLTKADWAQGATTLSRRVAVVALGLGGFLPVVLVYVKSIRIQDEFSQRIHLVALAIAFAATAVISYAVDLLHQSGFVPALPVTGLWAVMTAIWFVCMFVTARLYR